jgi:hypothetical protein
LIQLDQPLDLTARMQSQWSKTEPNRFSLLIKDLEDRFNHFVPLFLSLSMKLSPSLTRFSVIFSGGIDHRR